MSFFCHLFDTLSHNTFFSLTFIGYTFYYVKFLLKHKILKFFVFYLVNSKIMYLWFWSLHFSAFENLRNFLSVQIKIFKNIFIFFKIDCFAFITIQYIRIYLITNSYMFVFRIYWRNETCFLFSRFLRFFDKNDLRVYNSSL